jgi:Fe2+ or Zn2+ uptake regulation protein
MNMLPLLLDRIKAKGGRMTKLRQSLLDIFSSLQEPLSLEDIQERLKKMGLSPHRVSLYRELEFLKSEGIVETVTIESGKVRYELSDEIFDTRHHHHLICMNCEKIEDIPVEDHELLNSVKKQSARLKFTLLKHSLEFFGLCKTCR